MIRAPLIIGVIFLTLLSLTALGQASDHTSTAADALFRHSDIRTALRESALALKSDPTDVRALFVAMEASALEADDAAVLRFATRLCATGDDTFCEIAAARIAELAGNTPAFRDAVPRIQQLIDSHSSASPTLRLALVAAAANGAPEFDVLMKSRESGLLTDWRIVGPLGRYPNRDFDRTLEPERDNLRSKSYGSRHVSGFQFSDGKVEVPEAQGSAGIYYAVANAELDNGGEWRVWIESPGTLEVFVDGVSVMRKDNRIEQQPEVMWKMRRIDSGTHRVLVKFLSNALPFRVAIMPPAGGVKRKNNKPVLHAGPEAEYVSVALRYWRGDYVGTVRALQRISAKLDVASAMLLARAWQKGAGTEANEARAALLQASKSAVSSTTVQIALAEQAVASDRTDEALARLKSALTRPPQNETALRLFAQLASRLQWRAEAVDAYERLAALHPSCANLREAAWYLAGAGEYVKANSLVPAMKSCAPGSLLYSQWLAESGRHAEAAAAAAEVASKWPLSREALSFQWAEAQLAGDQRLADRAAESLASLAPESPPAAEFTGPAENPRAAGFSDSAEFYSAYRRDGPTIVRDLQQRKYSGGPAVTLLFDKVASLRSDGHTAVYVHTVTRVLNRDGIEKYGEVALPAGASLIELRTIKPDGTIIEPELNQHKPTISMPALTPGDAIDLEYVMFYPGVGGVEAHRDAFEFAFGSFSAPIVISRFVVISPANLAFSALGSVPQPSETDINGMRARVWRRDNIQQSTNEGLLPRGDLLPVVRAIVPQDNLLELRSRIRDTAIASSGAGLRTMLLADSLGPQGPEALARALYTRVVTTITPDGSDFSTGEVASAEDTLASRRGSRTATLLALSRASGIRASLAMARTVAHSPNARYTHPLVVFHLPGGDVITDPESDEMPFGVLGPTLDRTTALAVPLETDDRPLGLLNLPAIEGDHLSIAEADIVFDRAGTFTARVIITMGASRATQMRSILRTIPRDERKHFFEQLAMRLFPGASDADGSVTNEAALDRPLRLEVTCTSRHFLDASATTVDIDQLAPTLGLRRMYATQTGRQWPMFIDSLLFESAIFRVRLPQGVSLIRRIPDADLRTEFGTYRASFTAQQDGVVEIRREFRIPVQVVRPDRYPDFVAFANRIDETERQRLTLGINPASPLSSN